MNLSGLLEIAGKSLSAAALLKKARTLDGSQTPGQLIEIAMNCPAIAPQQIPSEFVELGELVRKQNCKRMMEIGTFRGGTLFVYSWLCPAEATIISVDYHLSLAGKMIRVVQEPFFRSMVRPGQTLHLLRADSHQPATLESVRGLLEGAKLDFLFIDGDHSYEGARRDFEMYTPLVAPGGLVAFHDLTIPAVGRLWSEIKGGYRHAEFMAKPESQALGIGVLWAQR